MRSVKTILLGMLMSGTFNGGAYRALGEPLTFYFSGNVTFIHDFLDLDESVYVGAPFYGGYSFDATGVTDYYSNDPQVGLYRFGSSAQLWAQIGNYDFLTHDLGILIWNDTLSGDLYQPASATPFVAAGMQWSAMSILLEDPSGSALASDALPTGVPDLSDYPSFTGLLLHLPGDDLGIRGTLTSLTPEPGSLTILAVGTGVLLARRRRR